MEKKEITDEYVLSKEKLTSHEAADYLGISWWNLSDGLKNGTYTFGTAATGRGGRTVFTIYAKQVYDFKHGTCDINKQQYADLITLLKENAEQQKKIVKLMSALILENA